MAVRKRPTKPPNKKTTQARTKATAKTRSKPAAGSVRKGKAKDAAGGNGQGSAPGKLGIRVRMYRVGFGDFFLLTVPGNDGPAHILIDCGVHAADIKSMGACVQDLMQTTKKRLALVILTHYHADHMSGFASNYDDFVSFDHVGAVWITNRLDPRNPAASKFMAQLTSVAQGLQLRLGARDDPEGKEAQRKVFNALGVEMGAAGGGGGNAKALKLLQQGFKSKPPVDYYQGGD